MNKIFSKYVNDAMLYIADNIIFLHICKERSPASLVIKLKNIENHDPRHDVESCKKSSTSSFEK